MRAPSPSPVKRPPPVGRLAFVAVAAANVLRAGPSVAVRDAGELTSAAALLDVAHPTGFVGDLVAARVFMLVPIGDVAFRANVLMGLWGGLAAALSSRLAWALARAVPSRVLRGFIAALPAVLLAASPTVSRAATAMEVYTLALALSVLALALLAAPVRWPVEARARGLSFAAGASLLVHTGVRPAFGLALLACAWRAVSPSKPGAPSRALRALASYLPFGLLGALPALYLLVSARRAGPINWSDPRTLSGALEHLTAQRIREAYSGRTFVSWRMSEDLGTALGQLRSDLGLPALLLALAGVGFAFKHPAARWVAAAAVADLAYGAFVNPMGLVDRQNLFLAHAGVGLLAAFALARVASLYREKSLAQWSVGALALAALTAGAMSADARFVARADGWSPSEILGGAGALGAVPPRAVVFCQSDDLCGGAMYAQYIEGERPDVSVLPRQHLWDPSTWRRLHIPAGLRASAPSPAGLTRVELTAARMRWIVSNFPHELLRWQPGGPDEEQAARVRLGSAETPVLASIDGEITAVDLDPWAWLAPRTTEGFWSRRLAATVMSSTARRILSTNRGRTIDLLERCVALDDTYATPLVNLGVLMLTDRRVDESRAWLERAVRADPERVLAWTRLAQIYAHTNRPEDAERARIEARRRSSR